MTSAKHFFIYISLILAFSIMSQAQVTSAESGNWADASTWVGGVVPGTDADVVISDGQKVVLNSDATVNNITIDGTLEFENETARTLTVNGDLVGDSLKTSSVTTGPLIHTIVLYGDLNLQSYFDLRSGSNPNVGAADITFTGEQNSTVTGPSGMDVNGVTINKSNGAKVILGSNFIQNNNSSNPPLGILNLTSGNIETGDYEWRVRATGSAAGVQGGSINSYIDGTLVLYMPSGNPTKEYPLGDGENFRPLTVYMSSSLSNSGVSAKIIHADANTGSSTFSGSIDKVSAIRYYMLQNISNNNLEYYSFAISYGSDDGVNSGNTDLRVATSEDDRATWVNRGTWGTHTTDLNSPPTYIQSDSTDQIDVLSNNEIIYVALARESGSDTNPIPVELTSFNASVTGSEVSLTWITATETNNKGFEIERSLDNISFEKIGFVSGAGTISEQRSYSFADNDITTGDLYYRLKQIDFDGTFKYSTSINITVELPEEYQLSQNYPNPFNPSTTIEYRIPEAGFVSLKIYDVLGNEVKTLISMNQEIGHYTVTADLKDLSSGTYIYELKVNSFTQRNKMLLMK